ncbi:hypothetical protein V6N11_043940 [Hibiscus sabdariffa]|uniref:RNase H type-1 domain-containing protein n=1 Tax=Hibiscus sabdariffa TaxID=183260 RepID=A0ABR2RDQ5_9ROSI
MGSCVKNQNGFSSVFKAEARAAVHGLSFASELGFHCVILESDSKTLINKLKSIGDDSSEIRPFISDIKDLTHLFNECKFSFAGRDSNKAAHAIAAMGKFSSFDKCWIEEAPAEALSFIGSRGAAPLNDVFDYLDLIQIDEALCPLSAAPTTAHHPQADAPTNHHPSHSPAAPAAAHHPRAPLVLELAQAPQWVHSTPDDDPADQAQAQAQAPPQRAQAPPQWIHSTPADDPTAAHTKLLHHHTPYLSTNTPYLEDL